MFRKPSRSQWRVAGIIMAGLALHFLVRGVVFGSESGLEAFYFIGVPALFSALLALGPRRDSLIGRTLMATVIAIGASGIILGEGVACVIFASPLILGVAGLIANFKQAAGERQARLRAQFRRDDKGDQGSSAPLWLIIGFVMLSGMEGLAYDFDRSETVSAAGTIPVTADRVEKTVLAPPRFDRDLPWFLKLGFPIPTSTSRNGDLITVEFSEGEMKFQVAKRADREVTFEVVDDTTPISEWMEIERSVVTWVPVGDVTSVVWTVEYRRILAPGWYFAPIERYGISQMASYLLETVVRP